jgi:hypothetical protein
VENAIVASELMAHDFMNLFVNRRAYIRQSGKPHPANGRFFYYRPRGKDKGLSLDILRQHLEGKITIGLYAINPETQTSKWLAIDADFDGALEDLKKIQAAMVEDGLNPALEESRRGAHLWLFAEKPLPAGELRRYVLAVAARLNIVVKGNGQAEGIEIIPGQDRVKPGMYGNAIRAPLGIHRTSGQRYFFCGASRNSELQIEFLKNIPKITREQLDQLIGDLPPEPPHNQRMDSLPVAPFRPNGHPFKILEHVVVNRLSGQNFWARCPSCASQGKDNSCDNLAISVEDPRKYRCWAGCTRQMIRAAVGFPIPATLSTLGGNDYARTRAAVHTTQSPSSRGKEA